MRHRRVRIGRSMVTLIGMALATSQPTLAAVIITATQVGPDVVFAGSGTFDVSALTSEGNGNLQAGIDFGREVLLGGDPAGLLAVDFYGAPGQITFPEPFGSNLFTPASLGEGPRLGTVSVVFQGALVAGLVVPAGYVSEASLSSTSTFSGKTFQGLGIIPGTYIWSWGSGESADNLTLVIVPEPSTFGFVLAGLLGLAGWCRARA
jgi:hypothetical protein